MAKKKLNTATSSTKSQGLNPQRKVEVLGVLIIGISILLGLSVLSYAQEDYQYAKSISFLDLFNPDASQRLVQNWLGPVGAYISHFFVHNLFGYTSIILAILVGYLGWHVLRHRSARKLIWLSVLSVWFMILLSTAIGWLNTNTNFPNDSVWSGAAGVAISSVLQNFTNVVGSAIILVLLMLITSLLLVDRDLQKTIDNLKYWMDNMRHKMEEKSIARAEKKEIKAQEREDRLAEKRAQRESEKTQKEAKKTEKIQDSKESTIVAEAEPEEPRLSINDIVRISEEEERERLAEEQRNIASLDTRPRALLDKEKKENEEDDDDEIEVAVYKGQGDEEADERELDKINRDKAKEVPTIRYKFPTIDLLDTPPANRSEVDLDEIRENKRIILD